MSILPIHIDGSQILRKKAKPVKKLTDDVIKLIIDMFETMHNANGIGLAANQVGILQRIITVDISEVEGMENFKPIALINPEVYFQKGKWTMEEGCLSIPEVRDEVERSKVIKIRYKNTNFEDAELEADDLLARVILHEIDHLNGVLFIDYLSSSKRKAHEEELRKIKNGEIQIKYPIITTADVPF